MYTPNPFVDAYDRADIEMMDALYDSTDIGYIERTFTCACMDGNIEAAKWFIRKGVNVNCEHGKPIGGACLSGNLPLVKLLVENGANNTAKDIAFIDACKTGKIETVKYLHSVGANATADRCAAFNCCCCLGYVQLVKWFISVADLREKDLRRGLIGAINNGRTEVVIDLVSCGARLPQIDAYSSSTYVNKHMDCRRREWGYLDEDEHKQQLSAISTYIDDPVAYFKVACRRNHLGFAKLLFSLCKDQLDEVINDLFINACNNDHYYLARFLIMEQDMVPIFTVGDQEFIRVCIRGKYVHARWKMAMGYKPSKIAVNCASQLVHSKDAKEWLLAID